MTKLLLPEECNDKKQVGSKAYNLAVLKAQGFNVPDFRVIPMNQEVSEDQILDFVKNKLVAVRSGSVYSLPGLMVSFLNVSEKEVMTKIKLVKQSWNLPLTQEIKKVLKVPSHHDTAVILQDMVNPTNLQGSGVASLINPITQKFELCVSYRKNMYGDNVVLEGGDEALSLEQEKELIKTLSLINSHFNKLQEVEFCITDKIEILQTRDLVFKEKLFNETISGVVIGSGLGSHQGVVSGRACFENPSEGDILCLKTLNPSEITSLIKAKAILAKKGDHNSHLAILCRLLKKPYILQTKLESKITSSDVLVLDTDSGKVYKT